MQRGGMPRTRATAALLVFLLGAGCTLVDQRTFNPQAGKRPVVAATGPGPAPPLVTVDYAKPDPQYAAALHQAVADAVAVKPDVQFDVVTVVPGSGTPAQQVSAATGLTARCAGDRARHQRGRHRRRPHPPGGPHRPGGRHPAGAGICALTTRRRPHPGVQPHAGAGRCGRSGRDGDATGAGQAAPPSPHPKGDRRTAAAGRVETLARRRPLCAGRGRGSGVGHPRHGGMDRRASSR